MAGIQDQRVFVVDSGGNTTDFSIEVNSHEENTATISLNADVDYLYIATHFPFNHKYFKISSANGTAAALTIEHWWANQWIEMVDTIDRTDSSGTPFAQSGIIHLTIDDEKGWEPEDESEDLDGFTKEGIYDKYWLRISADANISFDLDYIGQLFGNDNLLYQLYPAFQATRIKNSFESGKTDWLDQHILAAEAIVHDLKTRNIIKSREQILKPHDLRYASVHKAAELIYGGLTRNYDEEMKAAQKRYFSAINMSFYNIDKDKDSLLDEAERNQTTMTIGR